MKSIGFIRVRIAAVSLLSVLLLASAGGPAAGETPRPVTLLKGTHPYVDGPAQRVFFYSTEKNESELIRVYERLERAGARAISLNLPDAVVCELPLVVDPVGIVEGTGVVARTQPLDGIVTAPALPADLDWLRMAYDIHDARKSGVKPERNDFAAPGGVADVVHVSRSAIERSAVLADERKARPAGAEAEADQDDRLPDQNAEFLAGNIHIQIVFLEQKDSGSWTSDEKSDVRAAIEIAKIYFEQQNRNLRAKISTRTFDADVGWDPITRALTDELTDVQPLVDDVMTRMGYYGTPGEYIERVNDFNNNARQAFRSADWVFTVFVVDSSHDIDHAFGGRKQLFAQLGGPFMILAYPALVPGLSNFEQYFKHAMTMIFWAMPEDKGSTPGACGSRTGYLNEVHGNKVTAEDPLGGRKDCDNDPPDPCIAMLRDAEFGYSGAPCEFTKGQLGNRDSDNDNVPDIFDAPPRVIFLGQAIDTLTTLGQPVRFNVRSRAVPNQNSQQNHERRDYATGIERVSYRLNGIGPIIVEPVDGVADEVFEQYELAIEFLLPGFSEIEVTAWNNFGAKSVPMYKDIFYVGLDYFSFRFEHQNDGTGVAWYLRGNTFDAELELHRIDYSDDSDEVIAGPNELQPVRPKKDGLTPYYFLDRTASAGKPYGYYVTGNFELEYRGAMTPFSSSSSVFTTVASIPRAEGILSVPAPNPFKPGAGDELIRLSINIPGAQGIPLFNRPAGMSGAPAQQEDPEPISLRVGVYDVAGREVRILFDRAVYAPVINVEWDGRNKAGRRVPSGMYFIKARAAEVSDTKKVLVIR